MSTMLDVDVQAFAEAFGRRSVGWHTDCRNIRCSRTSLDRNTRTTGCRPTRCVATRRPAAREPRRHGCGRSGRRRRRSGRSRGTVRGSRCGRSSRTTSTRRHRRVSRRSRVRTSGDREGGVVRRSGYIFVTSPGSTTPMHFDPEHSFLLQVHGTKRVCSAPMPERVGSRNSRLTLLRRGALRVRRDGRGARRVRPRAGCRRVPAVIRAALGRRHGRRLGVVLDPLLHAALRAHRPGAPGEQASAATPPFPTSSRRVAGHRPGQGFDAPVVDETQADGCRDRWLAGTDRMRPALCHRPRRHGRCRDRRSLARARARCGGFVVLSDPGLGARVVGNGRARPGTPAGPVARGQRSPLRRCRRE